MGVIKRQGVKQSLVSYLGIAISALGAIVIYPQNTEAYGLARFFIDTAILLMPLAILGGGAVSIKFFPIFQNKDNGHNGLLVVVFTILAIGSSLFLLLSFIFQESFLSFYNDQPADYLKYFRYIPLAVLLMALFSVLYNYCTNFNRIVIPSIFQNFIRFSLPILILLFIYDMIGVRGLIFGILLTLSVSALAIIFYLKYLKEFTFRFNKSFLTKERISSIRKYAMFSLFGGIGSMLAFRIDSVMIPTLVDFKNNGAYSIAAFIGNAIAIPTMAIIQIASPIIAESLNSGDLKHVKFLYQKSSINLMVIGLLFFVLISASVEDLFLLMPGKNLDIKISVWIVLILGLTKLIDMATSINNQIINYSKYYRFNLYAILLLAVFNVGFNLWLIPVYGIIGAALATFLSLLFYNIIKLIYIKYRFNMQPFDRKTIPLLLIAVSVMGGNYFIPEIDNHILSIVLKSIIIGSLYLSLIYYFRISEDINEMINQWSKKALNWFSNK